MFVCDECINNFIIDGNLERLSFTLNMRSWGRCEDCHKVKECYDLTSGTYAHKDSIVGKSQIKNGRLTIGSLRKNLIINPSRRS